MPPWRRHSQYSKSPEPAVGYPDACAGLAQLVEHLSCKEKVIGSNPIPGSEENRWEAMVSQGFLCFSDAVIADLVCIWSASRLETRLRLSLS